MKITLNFLRGCIKLKLENQPTKSFSGELPLLTNTKEKTMLTTTLLGLMLACGDSEEQQTIPAPPAKTEEVKLEEKAPVKPAEEAKPEEANTEGDAAVNMEGTKPEVKVSEKLITTGEVKSAQPKAMKGLVNKALKAKAKESGFSDVKNIKMIKNSCEAGGTCVGIGQGTAVNTTITYGVGNAVTVKLDDGTVKDAIIKSIDADKYTVQFADSTESVVEQSVLGLRK